MSEGNESYIVKSINLLYYHPARLEDELTVSTEIELVSKARTIFFQSVLNSKK
jgi:acyl-CoA thioesterase FadM